MLNDEKIRIAAGLVFYNDAKCIEHCIKTLVPFVDEVIAIDGKYEGYDSKEELSTDGSREILKQYDIVKLYDYPNLSEPAKRQKYCEIARDRICNFLLVIDSDEYIVRHSSSPIIFKQNIMSIVFFKYGGSKNIFKVKMREPPEMYSPGYGEMFIEVPRLWYRPQDIEYVNDIHWQFRNKNEDAKDYNIKLETKKDLDRLDLVDGLVIGHSSKCRSKERTERKVRYQEKMIAYERKVLESIQTTVTSV